MTANFCKRKDKQDSETDYFTSTLLKENVKNKDGNFMYVTVVPVGGCKAGLIGSKKEDFDRRMILAIMDSEIVCETSCQSLTVMSKDKSKPLSLVERNRLNFAKVEGRTLKAGEALYKRTFGYYFENIANVKSIDVSFAHEEAKGTPKLNSPSGTFMWNFYISAKIKLNIKGIATKKSRSLAKDRTGILRV